MNPVSYSNSFIHGLWSENSLRFWLESRMRFINDRIGLIEDYYQCAACKSEDTFAESNLFYEDNYDFTPVFGPAHGIIFRRYAYLNDNYKTTPEAAAMWGGQYKLKEPDECRLLTSNADIRQATNDGELLVAQTEISNPELGLRAIIEYPIKTMNIHNGCDLYQVDTGPVLFPDLSQDYEKTVDALSLAYVAFNTPHFADFVIEQPTSVMKEGTSCYQVHHYSRLLSLPAQNRLFAFKF